MEIGTEIIQGTNSQSKLQEQRRDKKVLRGQKKVTDDQTKENEGTTYKARAF